jgi:hypothetical protein
MYSSIVAYHVYNRPKCVAAGVHSGNQANHGGGRTQLHQSQYCPNSRANLKDDHSAWSPSKIRRNDTNQMRTSSLSVDRANVTWSKHCRSQRTDGGVELFVGRNGNLH